MIKNNTLPSSPRGRDMLAIQRGFITSIAAAIVVRRSDISSGVLDMPLFFLPNKLLTKPSRAIKSAASPIFSYIRPDMIAITTQGSTSKILREILIGPGITAAFNKSMSPVATWGKAPGDAGVFNKVFSSIKLFFFYLLHRQ